jgi:hypothetical protein
MNIRAAATSVSAFIFLAVVSALITANVGKLADKHGWDNFLVRWTEKLLWERLRGLWWLWSIFGLSVGIALALWLTPQIVGAPTSENDARQMELSRTREQVEALQSELDATKHELENTKMALQQTERRLKAGTPTTGFQPPESPFLESLRKSDGVTLIDPTQNQLPISRIPTGRFAYSNPNDIEGFIRNHYEMSVSYNNNSGIDFEIHKSENGIVSVIGFLTEQNAIEFQDPTHDTVEYTIFSAPYKSNIKPIRIQLADIRKWSWRLMTPGGGTIICIAEIRLMSKRP